MNARISRRLGWVTLVISGGALLLGCQEKEEAPTPEKVIRPVKTATVVETSAVDMRKLPGVARAQSASKLSFKVSGSIEVLSVKVGDEVEADAPIAELDAADYELRVEEAKAGLAQARAQSRAAKAAYKTTKKLYASRGASKSELDAARGQSDSASAAVRAGNKQLEMAKRQVEYTELKAPRAGTIAEVLVEVNENVAPSQTVVLLTSGGNAEVQFDAPESLISSLNKGMTVKVGFDAVPGTVFDAKVSEVGVPGQRTTFPVTAVFEKADPRIRQGMAAEVELSLPTQGAKLVVPSSAVGEDLNGRFVFVIEAKGDDGLATASRREVEVGELTGRGLVVTKGLKAGETVASAGVSKIRDGLEVRLMAKAE